jgi:hypothetical protein
VREQQPRGAAVLGRQRLAVVAERQPCLPAGDILQRQVRGVAAVAERSPGRSSRSTLSAAALASTYPGYSFAISADAGGGNTMAAKRMVAEAARRALDGLRVLGGEERVPAFTLPLYVPLGELPTTWDSLVQASVAALPALAEPGLEIAVALASTLRADNPRPWRALVGWRFFHDRAFAFLVADRVARHAAEDPGPGSGITRNKRNSQRIGHGSALAGLGRAENSRSDRV